MFIDDINCILTSSCRAVGWVTKVFPTGVMSEKICQK